MKSTEIGKAFIYSDATTGLFKSGLQKHLRVDLAFTNQPTTVLRRAAVEVLEALQPDAQTRRVLSL